MSKTRESSYYQVDLTNRQVVAAFSLLLACLVAAFFSGVWVGKSGEARAETPPAPAQPQIVDLEEPPEVRFFSDAQEQPIEEIDVGSPPAAATGEPPAGPRGAATEEPKPAPPAAARQAQPTSRPPSSSPPAASQAASPPVAAGDSFVVQVLSSRDADKARQTLSRLRDAGYPAALSTVRTEGQLFYRVRVGPYRGRAAGDAAADEIRTKFKLETWVTSETTP